MARTGPLTIKESDEKKKREGRRASSSLPSLYDKKCVLGVLRKAGLLAEPTPEMCRQAEEYDVRRSPAEQAQLLAELRSLRLKSFLSATIIQNRE